MQDLDACIRSTYHYHQLRIAGLLRLLVFDAHPIVHQIDTGEAQSHTARAPLTFRHAQGLADDLDDSLPTYVVGDLRVWQADLEPQDVEQRSGEVVNSTLSSWRRVRCMRVGANDLTVLEFTKHMAYLEGLTHPGRPKTDLERALVEVRDKLRTSDLGEPNLYLLRQIGRITHTALTPKFNNAVLERVGIDGPYPQFVYEGATD